jgi:predicted ester cyclase
MAISDRRWATTSTESAQTTPVYRRTRRLRHSSAQAHSPPKRRKAAPVSAANKAAITQLYERISDGDLRVIDERLSNEFVDHELVAGLTPDKAGVKQLFTMVHAAFGNARLDIEHVIAEGDKVFALVRLTGTHEGDFMGIAATGRAISVELCDLFRVENGIVLEHWGVMDSAGLMRQLTA